MGKSAVPAFAEADLPGNDTFPLALTTAKTVYFCHSQHRNVPSLRKREPEPLVYLSPMTASDLCLSEGDWAKVTASEGWIRLRVRHDKSLHPKVVRASYGWWQANAPLQLPGFDPFTGGANYNMLTGAKRLDRMSGSAPMRSLSCRVEPISQAPNSG